MKRLILCLLFALSTGASSEVSIEEALKETNADLLSTQKELAATRKGIMDEKPELSAKFEAIALELRQKRRLHRIAQFTASDRAAELRALQIDLDARSADATYVSGLLKDFALKTETLNPPGTPPLDISPKILAASPAEASEAIALRIPILSSALDQLEATIGGSAHSGMAINPSGEILDGTFANFGPLSYFLSKDQSFAGSVYENTGAKYPSLDAVPPKSVEALLGGDRSSLPIDLSLGNARLISNLDSGPLDLIRKGGLWIWPILGLALLALVFGIIKLIGFLRYKSPSDGWLSEILAAAREGNSGQAAEIANSQAHPAGPVLATLASLPIESPDLVEETLYERLMSVQAKATSLLPVIAITAATAPLLGLLGTVSGMISTFNLITIFGSGDPKPLAGGISEALITTLFGLIVAIPALILHAFLSRRAQGIIQITERMGLTYVNAIRRVS